MRSLLVLAALFAIVPVALAGAVRSVTAPALVTALAADGPRIAYATGRSASDCNRVFVWNLSSRRVSKLGRKTHCEQTSTGNAIAAVSIAGQRVLWVHYVGGNQRDWTLWTATTLTRAPRLLGSTTVDWDDPAPILLAEGSAASGDDLLAYSVGNEVTGLLPTGARAFRWRSASMITTIASDGRNVVVGRANGTVVLVSNRAVPDVVYDGGAGPPITALSLSSGRLFIQRGRTLIFDGGDGPDRTFTLPRRSRLVDAEADRALVVTGQGVVQQVEFRSGVVVVRSLGSGRFGQLEAGYTTLASDRVVRLIPR